MGRAVSLDGMFDMGGIMITIHDVQQPSGGGHRRYKVCFDIVNHGNQPLLFAIITPLDMAMPSYMTQITTDPSI